jgi:hypothetical protein
MEMMTAAVEPAADTTTHKRTMSAVVICAPEIESEDAQDIVAKQIRSPGVLEHSGVVISEAGKAFYLLPNILEDFGSLISGRTRRARRGCVRPTGSLSH